MPVGSESIYRRRSDILASMISDLTVAIPDAYTGDDSVIRIIYDIESGQLENLYLAEQLLLEDMFISTASYQALVRHGDQYGLPMKQGTRSSGTLVFEGEDGTFIPAGTLAAYSPGSGIEPVYFETLVDVTISSPGLPTPPNVVNNDTGTGNLNGVYEYVVSFVTSSGETLPSDSSNTVTVSLGVVDLTAIPLGGPGTISRRIYRDKGGAGNFRQVVEIAENSSTTYTDNITDAAVDASSSPVAVDTAHQVFVPSTAQETGSEGNVAVGTITVLASAPPTLTSVTNTTDFTGGSDAEDSEHYRQRLLGFVQTPETGSAADLKLWAESVDGVETATVFENDPGPGQVTVRISGPGNSIPSSELVAEVQQVLNDRDYANITIIVSSFTGLATDVTVDVTTEAAYTVADVTPSVQNAITNYINNLPVGGTLLVAGIIDSVFGLAGIADVVVTIPATNQTTPAGQKRTAGTITVN